MTKTVLESIIKKYSLKGATGTATWFYEDGVLRILTQDEPGFSENKLLARVEAQIPDLTLPQCFTITAQATKALLKVVKGMPDTFDVAVSEDCKIMTLSADGIERTVLLDSKVANPWLAKQKENEKRQLLDGYAKEIVSLHANVLESNRLCEDAGRAMGRSAVENAISAGGKLAAAKKLVGHGNWLRWLETNCSNISDTTAQKYMRLYQANSQHPEIFKDLPSLTHAYLECGAIKSPPKKKSAKVPPSTPVAVTPVAAPAVPPVVAPEPVAPSTSEAEASQKCIVDGVAALEEALSNGRFTLEDATTFLFNHKKELSTSLLKPLADYYTMMTMPIPLTAEPQVMDKAA